MVPSAFTIFQVFFEPLRALQVPWDFVRAVEGLKGFLWAFLFSENRGIMARTCGTPHADAVNLCP